MPQKPVILQRHTAAQSRLFHIEELHLRFSNGQERIFERLQNSSHGAVLIVALNKARQFYLVREYAAGVDSYQLAFPKGIIERNETVLEAANREMSEELGFIAQKLTLLRSLTLAPNYMSHETQIVLAEDLSPYKIEGDEPEPLEIVCWSLDNLDELLRNEFFTEARSFAALFLLERHLQERGNK